MLLGKKKRNIRLFIHTTPLLRSATFALLGLMVLLVVQRHFEQRELSMLILIGLLVAIGLWALALDKSPPVADNLGVLQPSALGYVGLRVGMSAFAAVLAVLAWRGITGNEFTQPVVILWLGAVLLWLAAWSPWGRPLGWQRSSDPAEQRKRWIVAAILLGITAFGAWLRFHRLYFTPYDMTQDHSWKLLDVKTILDGGRPIFFPNNTGREPWQFYYTAVLMRVFNLPLDYMALKIGNGIIGTITIPIIYLFGRELGGRKLGLFAAALYTIGKWPLETTRMGLRFPHATLPAALVLWYLWRYVRAGRRSDALWVGIWMGVGLYGYIGIRAVPFVIAAVFGLLLFDRRRRNGRSIATLFGHGMLILVTSALIFLPLGHFMQQFPDQFWYRVATRTTDRERSIEKDICSDAKTTLGEVTSNVTLCKVGVFAYNNVQMALAFNWRGDRNEVNTVSYDPFLDYITAALLLAALPVLVWRLFVERSLRWWMTVIALPLLLLTTTLSIAFPIENPSTARTGVAMPVLFVIAAAPLALLSEWVMGGGAAQRWLKRGLWRWAVLGGLCLALFAVATQENYVRYFRDLDRQYRGFVPNTGEIAQAIKAYSNRGITNDNAFFVGWPYWFESRALSVHLGDIAWHETHELRQNEPIPPLVAGQPRLYVLNREDEKRRTELQQTFPNGELKFVATPVPSKSFYLFYIPAQ